jgi:hypothetical protein
VGAWYHFTVINLEGDIMSIVCVGRRGMEVGGLRKKKQKENL